MQKLVDSVIQELEQGRFTEAIKYCDKLIIDFPKNYIFYEIKGNCLLETGNTKEAIENYSKAIKLIIPTDEKSKSDLAALYNRRGFAKIKENDLLEAVKDFKQSLTYKPEFAEAYNNKGNVYRKLEKYEKAIRQCTKAIEIKPDFAEAYNNRGNNYYLLSKDTEAINDYTKAIELKQNYAGAYYNRGTAYYYLKNDLENAKQDWETALKLNPSYENELKDLLVQIENKINAKKEIETEIISSEIKSEETVIKPPTIISTEIKYEETVIGSSTEIITKEELPDENKPVETVKEIPKEVSGENIPIISELKKESEEILNSEEPKTESAEITDLYKMISDDNVNIFYPDIQKADETAKTEKEELKEKEKTSTDIDIPNIDFKSIFSETEKESSQTENYHIANSSDSGNISNQLQDDDELKPLKDIFETIEEPIKPAKNIIPEKVKELHEDIERTKEETNVVNEIPIQKDNKTEKIMSPSLIGLSVKKEKRGFFKSPIFLVLIILIFLSIIFYGSYLFIQSLNSKKIEEVEKKNKQELKDTIKSSTNIDSSQIKDTSEISSTTKETNPPVENKEQETKKPETPQNKETESKSTEIKKSEITSINNFIVVNEPNGIYLQIASFKDKNAADKKLESLKSRNVNLQVVEADLGTKGKYFRVRAGAFKNIDEAKVAADKLK